LSDVTKIYPPSFKAVERVSLAVEEGAFTTLLGPSGSGKTTTLMMIAGFELPTSGRIVLAGREITTLPPYDRNIGMVFQSYALFPHLTVQENVAFPLQVRKRPRAEAEASVRRALELVQLEAFADRYPRQLSGGQQQRVALARAIVFESPILLMDEPLGALDKNLRHHMQGELKRLQRRLGVTVIYVTHDQDEAMSMSDTVVVMNGGRIVQTGSPHEIYRHPRTRFVAEFLGETNLLRAGSAGSGSGSSMIQVPGGPVLTVPDKAGSEHGLYSLRPEDITLSRSPVGNPIGSGVVEEVVFLGDALRCRVVFPGGLALWVKTPSSRLVSAPVEGETMWVSWPSECLLAVSED
jgi:spermidine/putrescine ABC transporter ATP-binding subunit